jgi:hypothetical protein
VIVVWLTVVIVAVTAWVTVLVVAVVQRQNPTLPVKVCLQPGGGPAASLSNYQSSTSKTWKEKLRRGFGTVEEEMAVMIDVFGLTPV